MAATPDNDVETTTEWDAYSDYALVSKWVTKSIRDAIEAFALLDQANAVGHKIDSKEETQLRSDILSASMRLRVELEAEADRGEEYADDILADWIGSEGEDGYIQRFRATPARQTANLEFLSEFAAGIRKAGWELGYLQAGREQETVDEGDRDDAEVTEIIQEMTV